MFTRQGEPHDTPVDADRLDDARRAERERIHLLLLDHARRGWADVAAGRVTDARAALSRLQRRAARPAAD